MSIVTMTSVTIDRDGCASCPTPEPQAVRAGQGEAMVIVAADVDARDVQQMIVDLAERFLVLAAAPAIEGGRAFERWLRNFLDGLGVSAAHVLFHASVPPALIAGDD